MSTMREWTEENDNAIQEINTSYITETNLPIYATAAVIHRKLHPDENTTGVERNISPWQIRIEEKLQYL